MKVRRIFADRWPGFTRSFMQAAGMQVPETFGQLDANLRDHDLAGPLAELMGS